MIAIDPPKKTCKLPDCTGHVVGWGYCSLHYQRLKRYGDAAIEPKRAPPGAVLSWLLEHVNYVGKECLTFPFGRTSQGYGGIAIGRFSRAHRWMCHEVHGPSPEDRPFALHDCGNGHLGCVNPHHLYWGTSAENYQDQVRHGTAVKGQKCGKSVLTEQMVHQIRDLRAAGATHKTIALSVGAQKAAVRSVLRGRTWGWLE